MKRVSVADAVAQVKAGQFRSDPAAESVQVDDDTALSRREPASIGAEEGGARIVSWRPDRMEVEVENKQSGVLVVHEAYYPGWVAEVDGKPARILRTNVLFRGVEVGEGRHVVVFHFEPFSLSNLGDALLGLFGKSS